MDVLPRGMMEWKNVALASTFYDFMDGLNEFFSFINEIKVTE